MLSPSYDITTLREKPDTWWEVSYTGALIVKQVEAQSDFMRVRYGLEDENEGWTTLILCFMPHPVSSVIAWGLPPASFIFQTPMSAGLWLVQQMGGATGSLEKKKGSQGTSFSLASSLPHFWQGPCFFHSLVMAQPKLVYVSWCM